MLNNNMSFTPLPLASTAKILLLKKQMEVYMPLGSGNVVSTLQEE